MPLQVPVSQLPELKVFLVEAHYYLALEWARRRSRLIRPTRAS